MSRVKVLGWEGWIEAFPIHLIGCRRGKSFSGFFFCFFEDLYVFDWVRLFLRVGLDTHDFALQLPSPPSYFHVSTSKFR